MLEGKTCKYPSKIVFGIIIFVTIFREALTFSRTNFKILSLKQCPSEKVIKIKMNVTNENNKQFAFADIIMPFPGDEKIGVTVDIESALDGKIFFPLFKIRENYCCQAAHAYLREFVYDLERHMQMAPGVCPIRPGHYHVHHYELNFKNIALQTFPFGRLRFTGNLINNADLKSLFCMEIIVDNVEN